MKIKKLIILIVSVMLCVVTFAFGLSSAAYSVSWKETLNSVTEPTASGDCNINLAATEQAFLAEISYNNLLLRNGSIVRKLQVWVNESELFEGAEGTNYEMKKATLEFAKEALINTLKQGGYEVVEGDGYLEVPLESYDSYTDMYIAYGHDGYEVDEGADIPEKGVFFNKYTSTMATPFASIEGTIIEDIAGYLTLINGIDAIDVAYVYNYGTKYSPQLISSDADSIYLYRAENIYIHKFLMNKYTLDRQITLTQTSPNTLVWYGLALGVAACLTAIAITVAILCGKKQKEE